MTQTLECFKCKSTWTTNADFNVVDTMKSPCCNDWLTLIGEIISYWPDFHKKMK